MNVNDICDLIAKTSVELGFNTDAKTMAALAKLFYQDLQTDKRIKSLTLEQVQIAFRLGVRYDEKEAFLNIRTFYRWVYAHKKVIDNAYYEVHTLGKPKQETLYYQEPLKLLK